MIDYKEVWRLYEKGQTYEKIAIHFGCSRQRIHLILKKLKNQKTEYCVGCGRTDVEDGAFCLDCKKHMSYEECVKEYNQGIHKRPVESFESFKINTNHMDIEKILTEQGAQCPHCGSRDLTPSQYIKTGKNRENLSLIRAKCSGCGKNEFTKRLIFSPLK